jgi:hypothetical protein
MVSAGGTLIEILRDRAVALAPFGPEEARRLLSELKLSALLAGARGAPAADIGALAESISRFSVMAAALAPRLAEIDVNPIIAGPGACTAVDCLVIPAAPRKESES